MSAIRKIRSNTIIVLISIPCFCLYVAIIGGLNFIPFKFNIPIEVSILFFVVSIASYYYVYKTNKGTPFKLLDRVTEWLKAKWDPFANKLSTVVFIILFIPLFIPVMLCLLAVHIVLCVSFVFMTVPLVSLAIRIGSIDMQVFVILLINYIYWRVFVLIMVSVSPDVVGEVNDNSDEKTQKRKEITDILKIIIKIGLEGSRLLVLTLTITELSGYISLIFDSRVLLNALVATLIIDTLLKEYDNLIKAMGFGK